VRELRCERGIDLSTIVFYTEPDRNSAFVRLADKAINIGPATVEVEGKRKSAYLDYDRLAEALGRGRADAAWVGWGFVAEHPEFADLCQRLGIVFVGPPSEAMRLLGDKIESKRQAERAGVPVAPWSEGPVSTLAEARAQAERIGYPLLVKATAGGGGRGIRRVMVAQDLEEALRVSRSEALKAFGDDTVFMEKLVVGARHVEVQVVGDQHGNVWAVGVRDCSVQRRNQKLIEEAPSPALSPKIERQLSDHATALARAAGYQNAGTAEFLFEVGTEKLYFMEMNTRLQVEHPVTEATTGLDLVKLQLLVAGGHRLVGDPPPTIGHAIEVRLNAEDPDNNFAPSPGTIAFLRFPAGPGIRVDAGIGQGDTVPPEFDSMIGKIIAHGQNRAEAVARLNRALSETAVTIQGGTSNRTFLLELVNHPDFRAANVDLGWLGRTLEAPAQQKPLAEIALIQVAIESYDELLAIDQQRFLTSVARGMPRFNEDVGLGVDLHHGGQSYHSHVCRVGSDRYRVTMDNRRLSVHVARQNAYETLLTCGTKTYHVLSVRHQLDNRVEVDGFAHRISRDEGGVIRAPAPAVVLSILVTPGDQVVTGMPLAVLEAMKMEMPVIAHVDGRVKEVVTKTNVQVDTGTPLILLEPEAKGDVAVTDRVVFVPPAPSAPTPSDTASFHEVYREKCRVVLDDLRSMLLGYDVDPRETRSLLREYLSLRADIAVNDSDMLSRELNLFETFADVVAMGTPEDPFGQASPSLLGSFLRSFVSKKEDLPSDYLEKLERLCQHYGPSEQDHGHRRLYWAGKAHRRVPTSSKVIERLLEWHWQHSTTMEPSQSYRRVLDRLIEETRDPGPGVNAVARQLRYQCVDRPLLQQARERQQALIRSQLRKVEDTPDMAKYGRVVTTLVASPYPVLPLIRELYTHGTDEVQRALLEGYLRRFYRQQKLRDVYVERTRQGWQGLASYTSDRLVQFDVKATWTRWETLEQGLRDALRVASSGPAAQWLLLDLLVETDGVITLEQLKERVEDAVEGHEALATVSRLCISALAQGQPARHLTYTQENERLQEQVLFRDIHHMQAERLELWRLKNFDLERVPLQDVLVFRASAKENPRDRRLFAYVDVRDMSVVRDDEGNFAEWPELERLYAEALAAFRETHYRSSARTYDWNRVSIYPWAPVTLSQEDMGRLTIRLALPTRRLGLEKVVIRSRGIGGIGNQDSALHVSVQSGIILRTRIDRPGTEPVRTQSDYALRVKACRRRQIIYPYEIIRMLTPKTEGTSVLFPFGNFVEHDLDEAGDLVPVERGYGQNTANVIVGVISNVTARHPEGMVRAIILGDPSREMGALAEPECVRIVKTLDLAERRGLPVEWFPISSGAKISLTSGTENLDWTARVLRRIVEFTEAGGEINVVVNGVNVGAQSYWNAEATMLMHTRGILVMTSKGAMVLTGKRALDYSGGVSAEDNQGIGGLTAIMGPNGQAQFGARDITHACMILFHHYDCTYVVPGEVFPRRGVTRDPRDRSIVDFPHEATEDCKFKTVGEIFSDVTNPGRKRPFNIRSVMQAVVDQDHATMERWALMRDAETAVVMDGHVGGIPTCLIGIESHQLQRIGFVPGDGPDAWTGGTLFPLSSKKVARAINSASGCQPVVVLANLAGFDGSPESMRKLQLEYGAEIGRAVVRFRGPIVFCVISRYHGGAYVVFSRALNDNLVAAAVEGSYASVIGGAPAAAVVLTNEVQARTYGDPEIQQLKEQTATADETQRPLMLARLNTRVGEFRAAKQLEVATEFDMTHSIERAKAVGSLDYIVSPSKLRPYLIEALERGIRKIDKDYPVG